MLRKLYTLCLFTLLSLSLWAKDVPTDFSFLGIPLNHSAEEFSQQLRQRGFSFIEEVDGVYGFQGTYEAIDSCYIFVATSAMSDTVGLIMVEFPASETWQGLEKTFSDFKEKLTQAYGEPSFLNETFICEPYPQSNTEKLKALQANQCTYDALYVVPGGLVLLTIGAEPNGKYHVVLNFSNRPDGNDDEPTHVKCDD